ncbi:MAG: universal stress protein [Pseudomonadota bacterium]
MFNNVLMPVDLGHPESWQKALPAALDLTSAGGVLHLMTVVPDFGMSLVGNFFPKDFEQQALSEAKQHLQELARDQIPAGTAVQTHLAHGATVDRILQMANELSVDLIAMASHEPDQMREFLVGSNADRIVSKSPVSVLVVRG